VRPRPAAPVGILARVLLIPFVIFAAAALVAAGLFPAIGGAGKVVKLFNQQFAPTNGDLTIPQLALRSTLYAADGSVISQVADQNRIPVRLSDVADVAQDAVLAVEDHAFYDHGPIDVKSIARALIANVKAGQVVQGGSTITQQVVKNFFTGGEQTFQRKWEEARDAVQLERLYTKGEIFEAYLNDVYFGHGAYGIGTAAEYYFAKSAKSLTLPQAALLAAQISAPSFYDPVAHPKTALDQRNIVLRDMLRYRYITQAEHDQAVASPIKLSARKRKVNLALPYFAQFVQDTIIHPQKYDSNYKKLVNPYYKDIVKVFGRSPEERARFLYQGGLKIYTTEDPAMRRAAEQAARTGMPNQGNPFSGNPEVGLASVVPQSGAIRVLLGGPDYIKHKLDLAVQSRRQAGSAFKAFTLVSALEQGIPMGKVYDTPNPVHISADKCGQAWDPSNAEAGGHGFIDMTSATASSVNVYFAQLIADTGAANVQETARRMGVVSYAYNSTVRVDPFCAITLGAVEVNPLSMTAGFATLANNGSRCYPFAIQKIVSWTGKVLFKAPKPKCQQVVDPDIAAAVTSMLQTVVQYGTGVNANIGRPQAGKTGTAQDFSDAWFMGYVPQLATGVWVGYGYAKKNVDMSRAPILTTGPLAGSHPFGGTLAAPIWKKFMAQAVAKMPIKFFPKAPGPPNGKVPNVIGMKQADAEKTLTAAGFTPDVVMEASTEPEGTVFDQAPKGGSSVRLGSRVTIHVSNGKSPKSVVPNVVGKTQSAAEAALKDAGFSVQVVEEAVCDPTQDGVVLTQDPGGGKKANEGSTVVITVGKFEPPCPTPSPSPSP
jgi:membrane peptidoglycan carboxypeptidase